MARSTQSSSPNAREQARRMQQEQERKQRTTSLLLRVGVVVVAVAVVVGLAFFAFNRDGDNGMDVTQGPAPTAGSEQAGVTMTSASELAEGDAPESINTDELPAPGEDTPAGVEQRAEGEPPHITIYTDPGCVYCAEFETDHHDQLEQWLDEGLITVEYRSVAFLDGNSGTNYSSRAINAFYCMAEESPEDYGSYLSAVTASQPDGEMSDDELSSLADSYGTDIDECIQDGTFRAFTNYSTQLASAEEPVEGTPSVWIDEVEWATTERAFPEVVEEAIDEYRDETGDDADSEDPDSEESDSGDDAAEDDADSEG